MISEMFSRQFKVYPAQVEANRVIRRQGSADSSKREPDKRPLTGFLWALHFAGSFST